MIPSGPSVQILEQYAQLVRDTSSGKNGNDSRRVDPTNRKYDITLGDSNMARELVRHGPDALYAHIMRAAFDPVYGRAMSIAQQEFEKPQTRFPLAETQRQHERSENNNSPAKVYNIAEHPEFKPHNQTPGEKKDDKPYQPYKPNYGEKDRANNNAIIIYGLKAKKEKECHYSAKGIAEALKTKIAKYLKREYKAEPANDNEKSESLYQQSLNALSEIYNLVLKFSQYLAFAGYSRKSSEKTIQTYVESESRYPILSSSYIKESGCLGNSVAGKPAANDDYYELEKRVEIKSAPNQGGIEKLVA